MAAQSGLIDFFDKFLQKEPLIINKKVLQSNYIPDAIPHRQQQIELIASILGPALRGEKPSNIFVYGKPGVGKTVCVQYILKTMEQTAEKKGVSLKTIYINCKLKKIADTEYRIVTELARSIGVNVPATGLPTDEVYNKFLSAVDARPQIIILALDEIDRLVMKAGDEILYNLTRINSELKNAQIAIVGISNDVRFIENIDSRVKSSLNEEEVIFRPYDAIELKDILEKRASLAFRPNALEEGVLQKCAAFAAREHGDARRALDLLRVAGEVAERDSADRVKGEHIDKAEERIEKDRVLEIVTTQPKQSQLVLYAILLTANGRKMETGEVHDKYRELCLQSGQVPLTQRRVSDLIGELDMLGLINAKVISKGRYGRTREIFVSIQEDLLDKLKAKLQEDL
ncbi:MAG TPA: ORC1-type DNA replication protein [Candidatus Nanoarchaeia archaeon]|nr:ORC1-type DNA replication protein [Candidatus Nanoarchaeia archaeon]